MKTNGIIEVIVYVADMAAQVAFYRDVLGLTCTSHDADADFSNEFWVTFDAGGCVLALHGDGKAEHDANTPMIVFGVDDIAAPHAELVQRGIAMGDIFTAAPSVQVAHFSDPEGQRLAIEMHT